MPISAGVSTRDTTITLAKLRAKDMKWANPIRLRFFLTAIIAIPPFPLASPGKPRNAYARDLTFFIITCKRLGTNIKIKAGSLQDARSTSLQSNFCPVLSK
jgi:hypothetical protein